MIITVDNGICCKKEVNHAADLGIDVIVVDHHEPNDELFPEIAIVVDPKIEECGYPFQHISGCAVVYKLITALRFALNPLYKQEICLLNVHPINDAFVIEAYLCDNTTDVYAAVKNLQIGDVVDMEGFLYWYEGVNPHITSLTVAE